jgi:hypothetical protein
MRQCNYCREPIEEEAKVCKICGEPFYFVGKVLKFVPLLSVAIAMISLAIALIEIQEKQKATRRANVAERAHIEVSRELNATQIGADQALREIAQKLPTASKDIMIKDLQLPARATLEELEEKAKSAPTNADLQRKMFLFRALKGSEKE